MLPITDITGDTQLLTNVKQIVRSRKVNGEKTLQFITIPDDSNDHSFAHADNESTTIFKNEPYIIKQVNEKSVGATSIKQIGAVHTFFNTMINCYQYESITGSKTFFAALTYVFAPTTYTFSIVDSFTSEEFENLGQDNCLSLFQTILERYGAEFKVIGNHIYFYKQIGVDSDFQFRWKHNVKSLDKSVDSKNLSTYIKGYGKPKEVKDVLSGVSIPYASRTGTYYTESGLNELATDKVGATFRFSFTGTGFNFKTIMTFLGGKWDFSIDGTKNVQISTYKDVTEELKTIEIIRDLEHKSHNVIATFKGNDSKNPYTSSSTPAIGYLKSGNIIGLYRALVGDELFEVVTDYTSPNASKFPNPHSDDGLHHAEPISDERITTNAAMLTKLKKVLQDEPELSITVDVAELGLEDVVLSEGDRGFIVYEPMDMSISARIVEITETFEYVNGQWIVMKTDVTLANLRNKLTDVTTRFAQTSKRLDRLFEGQERLPYNVLPEAIRIAAEAINNSLTEIQYPVGQGIILQDPNNPLIMVRLTSAGIGLSDDGGATYRTAMTGFGIVTNELVAGVIRTNNIQIVGEDDLFYWNGEGLFAYNASDLTKYVKLNSDGLYIAKGALTIERPDGFKTVNNGLLQNEFTIQPTSPPFMSPTVSVKAIYYATTYTTPETCNAFFFGHYSRYLKVRVVLHDSDSGLGSRIGIVEVGNGGGTFAQTVVYGTTDAIASENPVTLTIDLGTPTGAQRGFYLKLNTGSVGGEAKGRLVKAWLEG